MNFDQIIREMKKLGLEPEYDQSGGSRKVSLSFNRGKALITCKLSRQYISGYSATDRFSFHAYIFEEVEGRKYNDRIDIENQTEFFNIIKELKTTDKSFEEIRNRKDIEEAEKEIKKLEKQFKELKYRLDERNSWLASLKGEITRQNRTKLNKESYNRIYGVKEDEITTEINPVKVFYDLRDSWEKIKKKYNLIDENYSVILNVGEKDRFQLW